MITIDEAEGGNSVTINFSNSVSGTSGSFYIPAPLGTYESVTAEMLDGDATLVSKTWHEQTVSRMTPKRGTVEVEYVADIDGKIYKNLQAAIDASYQPFKDYLPSQSGCAGSSASRASLRDSPNASATPSPYLGSA